MLRGTGGMQLSVKDDQNGCRCHIEDNSRHVPRYGNRRRIPDRIEVSGEWKIVAEHLKERIRQGREAVTTCRIKQVLEEWLVRGVSEDSSGQAGWTYWGKVEYIGKRRLMRVALSMDGKKITSAYLDRNATKSWQKGETAYFAKVCVTGIEVRDDFVETGLRCGD